MSPIKRITVLWACCALALPTIARGAAPQDVLASYDWSAKATPNLTTNPPPRDVVAAFIAGGSYLQPVQAPYHLCAFAFADLRHTGNLSLVASADVSGRMFCSDLFIVDKDSSQFEVRDIVVSRGASENDVGHIIKDLNGDGNLVLVGSKDLTGYMGGDECIAEWPIIYAWTGAGYANVSNRFPGFYRDELNLLNDQIASLPPSSESRPGPYDLGDCLKAEAAKIQRFLGISATAGLSQAEALASSADPDTRAFAIELLKDIGTPEAFNYIKKLAGHSQSNNAGVTHLAQAILAKVQRPGGYQNVPPQPVQFKSVPFISISTTPPTAAK